MPYVGCCAECAGLRLDLPAAEFWDRLASEAANSDSASDGEEIGGLVGEEVATPRLRRSTHTARGGQGRPFYGGLSGLGDNGAQRSPDGVRVLLPRRQFAVRGHVCLLTAERCLGV